MVWTVKLAVIGATLTLRSGSVVAFKLGREKGPCRRRRVSLVNTPAGVSPQFPWRSWGSGDHSSKIGGDEALFVVPTPLLSRATTRTTGNGNGLRRRCDGSGLSGAHRAPRRGYAATTVEQQHQRKPPRSSHTTLQILPPHHHQHRRGVSSTSRSRLDAAAGRDGGDVASDSSSSSSSNSEDESCGTGAEDTGAPAATTRQGVSGAPGGGQGWVGRVVAKIEEALPEPPEAKKILPLGIMLFFILFDYTILRDTKDVLVVTAPSSGAEVIPFLKTYVNLPGAVIFTVLYSKLCNSAEQERVFYTVMGFFLSFFAVFAAFLYPNRDVLSTAALADSMQGFLPEGLSALSSIVRNWTFSLFYLMSELWGSVVVSVLFWGFANDIVSVSEAKRFYPLFGLGANVALVFSGQYVRLVSSVRQSLPPEVDKWGVSLQLLMGAVVTGGMVVAGCYRWMQDNVITDPDCVDAGSAADMKETTSLTLRESAAFLAGNAYLRDVAILVIAYGTSINIVEVTWKAKLKLAYPDPNDYSAFMGNFSSTTGLVTLGMMLLGGEVFKNYGWETAAKATPVVLLVTGAAFFSLSMFGDAAPVQALLGALSTSPLALAVLAGAAQNVLSKSCKYSLFDPCKEMAYIPLSQEEKRKGKAAVDVIGNPLGKSTGSFVQQGLFLATGSLQASTPYLGGVLLAVITTWLLAADALSKKFEGAMEILEGSAVAKGDGATPTRGPKTSRRGMKSAAVEETEELGATPAAAWAKPLEERTPVDAEGAGGESEEDRAADKEDSGGDDGDSGDVVYVPPPTRLPTPP